MKKQFSCNHNSCGHNHNGANSQCEPPYNFNHLRPTEQYTLEDEFLDYKSSEAHSSNISSQTQDKSADDYPWHTVSCLKQKACRVLKSDSEYTSSISEYTYHSQELQLENCGHNLNFLKKAKELMDYDPESIFLKKMKEQYLQQNSQILMPALHLNNQNAALPYACQDCLLKAKKIIKIGEDLSLQLTESCLCKQYNSRNNLGTRRTFNPGEEKSPQEVGMPQLKTRPIPQMKQMDFVPAGPASNFGEENYKKGGKKKKTKSQHISRAEKPRRCKGKRVRLSDGSVKCQSENEFEPTLKRPHENSCERCWRFASPPRSPVNKPEQKYDPNFRKARSQTFVGDGGGDFNVAKEVPEVRASPRGNVKSICKCKQPNSALQVTSGPLQRTMSRQFNQNQLRNEGSNTMYKEWYEPQQRRLFSSKQLSSQAISRRQQQRLPQHQQPQIQKERYVTQEELRQQLPRDHYLMPQQQYQPHQHQPHQHQPYQYQPHQYPSQQFQKQEQQTVQEEEEQWCQEQLRQQRPMHTGQRVSSKQQMLPTFTTENSFPQAPEKSKVAGSDRKVYPADVSKPPNQTRRHYQQPPGFNATENLTYNDFVQGLEETEYLKIEQNSVQPTRSPLKDLNASSRDKYVSPSGRFVSAKDNELKQKKLRPESPKTPKKKGSASPHSTRPNLSSGSKSPRSNANSGSKSPPSSGKADSVRSSVRNRESDVRGPIVLTTKAEVHGPPRSRTPSPRKPGNVSKTKVRKKEKPQKKPLPRTPSPDIQVIEEELEVMNTDPPARTPTHGQQGFASSRDRFLPLLSHSQESSAPGPHTEGYRKRYFSCHCFAKGNRDKSKYSYDRNTYRFLYENTCPCSGGSSNRVRIPRESTVSNVQCPFVRNENNQNEPENLAHMTRDEYNSMHNRTSRDYKSNFSDLNLGNMGYSTKDDTQWMSMNSRYRDQQPDAETTLEESKHWKTMMPSRRHFGRMPNSSDAHQNLNESMGNASNHRAPWSRAYYTSYPESRPFNASNSSWHPPRQTPTKGSRIDESPNWATMHSEAPFASTGPNSTPQNIPNYMKSSIQENDQVLPFKTQRPQTSPSSLNFSPNIPITTAPKPGKMSAKDFGFRRKKHSPRRYFVYYMTKDKENEKNEVEVLVEEFDKKIQEKKDTEAKEVKEKMKKVLECNSDSMALRFQKGVHGSCKNPPSSRTLYF